MDSVRAPNLGVPSRMAAEMVREVIGVLAAGSPRAARASRTGPPGRSTRGRTASRLPTSRRGSGHLVPALSRHRLLLAIPVGVPHRTDLGEGPLHSGVHHWTLFCQVRRQRERTTCTRENDMYMSCARARAKPSPQQLAV